MTVSVIGGRATAYRLFDVGYEIDLEQVAALLAAESRGRILPARAEARAFAIRQPPLSAVLGQRPLTVGASVHDAALSVHVFDFGVVSLRLTVAAPAVCPWDEFVAFGTALDSAPDLTRFFEGELQAVLERMMPAVQHPRIAPVFEDYVVFRLQRLENKAAPVALPDVLSEEHLVPLLLGERRTLSGAARQELLGNRYSYYADDLAVLTWDNALIIEPREEDQDVEFVLEFANAQLLELRVYDAELDEELPSLYDRIAAARRHRLGRRFRLLLGDVQARVAEVTEIVERADNAFKVTDDVYLARVYEKALQIFREHNWRSGIDRKLGIMRDTYGMLNAEAQAARGEILEMAIVLLIVFDIVLSLIG